MVENLFLEYKKNDVVTENNLFDTLSWKKFFDRHKKKQSCGGHLLTF